MKSQSISRRQLFAGAAALPAAAASGAVFAPQIATRSPGTPAANDRIRVGVIGVGPRANLLIDQLPEQAQVVAVSDCYLKRCEDAAAKRQAQWRIYNDYRKLLDQKDIDGVIVATHDFGRALCVVHACQAGKDVYAEKPLTLYVEEGRTIVKAARKYNRVVQVGTQQRSMAMDQLGSEFVRKGGLGRLLFVQGVNYPGPGRYTGMPEEPIPEGLDWNTWLNQTEMRPYNAKMLNGWGRFRDYSGGEVTNWGAHGLDQIQCALGTDLTGPTEFWPLPESGKGAVAFRYQNGVTVRLELPMGDLVSGAIFVGEKGRIELIRNNFRTDPPRMIKELPPPEEVQKWRDDVALWQAKYHMGNWLDCMRTREKPLADVEIGHRSVSICHLVGITREVNRKLKWDPEAERFIGDEEANGLLRRARRKGFELPEV